MPQGIVEIRFSIFMPQFHLNTHYLHTLSLLSYQPARVSGAVKTWLLAFDLETGLNTARQLRFPALLNGLNESLNGRHLRPIEREFPSAAGGRTNS